MSYSRSKSVAFSSMIGMEQSNFIIPLGTKNDIWSFLHPLSFKVWLFSLFAVPVFMLVWGLSNVLHSGHANWIPLVGFVLRNILSDHVDKLPDKNTHQKALIFGWIWFTFVMVTGYTGNLVAMITSPKLITPIREPGDFLLQDKISLVMEDGLGTIEHLRGSPMGSTWRNIYEEIDFIDIGSWPSGCFSKSTQNTGRHASLCDMYGIKRLLHKSFNENGQCKWYLTEDTFLEAPLVMVFQVCFLIFLDFNV